MFPFWIDLTSLPVVELLSCVISGLAVILFPLLGPGGR